MEFFSSRGTWHSLIGGDGPGEGWWGADEEDGRDGGSSEEEEVGGSGRPGGWRERGKAGRRREAGPLDKQMAMSDSDMGDCSETVTDN